MLKVSHLGYKRNQQIIFRNITFELKPGSWIEITGPNGSGKTTLLKILAGLIVATRGKIEWQGKEIFKEILNRNFPQANNWDFNFQYLSQTPSLYAGLTVQENLKLHALLSTEMREFSRTSTMEHESKYSEKNVIENARESENSTEYVIPVLRGRLAGIDQKKLCGQLSAGESQKICLERLNNKFAQLWLLDEPLNSLDKQGIEDFKKMFDQHLEQGGMIVLASHLLFNPSRPPICEIRLTGKVYE
jgi:heme exporter protein A